MSRTLPLPDNEYKRELVSEMSFLLDSRGIPLKKQQEVFNIGYSTYIRRRKDPGKYKIDELLNMCEKLDVDLCDLLDVKNKKYLAKRKFKSKGKYKKLIVFNIQRKSRDLGLEIKEQAKLFGTTISLFYSFRKDPGKYNLDFLLNICEKLDMEISDLFREN